MKAVASIEQALMELFTNLDREDFDGVASRLDDDVELADEITGEWLRGKERVAAYLRASKGVVTDVQSRISSLSTRWLTGTVGLATFTARQHYSLDIVPRDEMLTGTALFGFPDGGPVTLLLLHLGTPAPARESLEVAGPHWPEKTVSAAARTTTTLGERLRSERKQANLSLRALADRAGVSASLLSQVERGKVDPNLASLRRIADGLSVSIVRLIDDNGGAEQPESRIVRASHRRRIELPDSLLVCEFLVPDVDRTMEVWIGTLQPSASASLPPRSHDQDEFLLVLEGLMRLEYGGADLLLESGDSAYVRHGEPHRFTSGSDEPLRFLSALALPGGR
jgi:transcriptional regulator with XRE-family HTH domain